MTVERVVGEGNEGSAVPAEGDVSGAEVGDGGDAGASGDDGAFDDLKSGGGWRAKIGNGLPLVKNGLAVVANEIDFAGSDAKFFAGGEGGVGVNVAEAKVKLAEFAGGDGILFGDAEDFFADGGGEGDARVMEKFDLEIWRNTRDADEGDVDAVNGGAGHHAEDEGRFGWHMGVRTKI